MTEQYFNTTNKSGEDLAKEKKNCATQEINIAKIFLRYRRLSPSEVMKIYHREFAEVPLTSIRRAITNLTNDGALVKTKNKKMGLYGKPEYVWVLTGITTAAYERIEVTP
jgi:hypothetical protein